ncbi:MAG: hypothetical protein ACXIVD_06885 [Salinarimonas sp.]
MKIFAVMTFAAATALASVPALAEGPARGGPGGPGGSAAMLSQDDRAALADARIAAIRAGLRLTEGQEALFEPVAEALRAMSHNAASRYGSGARASGMQGENRDAMNRDAMQEMSREERRAMRSEMRAEMRERRADRYGHDFMERLERRSEMASANAAVMADLAQAMRPFWDGLDADQQRLLPILMQPDMIMRQHRHMGEHRNMGQLRHMGEHGGPRMRGRGAAE